LDGGNETKTSYDANDFQILICAEDNAGKVMSKGDKTASASTLGDCIPAALFLRTRMERRVDVTAPLPPMKSVAFV
jgi:hypothetical protein